MMRAFALAFVICDAVAAARETHAQDFHNEG
jgi:hypothetical protein